MGRDASEDLRIEPATRSRRPPRPAVAAWGVALVPVSGFWAFAVPAVLAARRSRPTAPGHPQAGRVRRVAVTDPVALARRHDYADVVVLADADDLIDTVMIGRNTESGDRRLTTVLRYRRPVVARAIWLAVGVLHRRTARRVVTVGLTSPATTRKG